MENSIEEDIKIIENFINWLTIDFEYDSGNEIKTIEHILSDYKRVLKENEELKNKLSLKQFDINIVYNDYLEKLDEYKRNTIPIQKIKDIIDRIDYDIKKTKEIISNNSNIYTSDRRNDYQIVRLRAMNTKSLDIKKRLQELLESEE